MAQEEVGNLARIAEALDILAKNACLFIGPRLRRVAAIEAMRTLKIEYEDGKIEYVAPQLIRRYVVCIHEPKDLVRIADALDILAKNAYLYGGTRRRPRRIASVAAEKTLRIKYIDGALQYIAPSQKRYFIVYITKPKNE